MIATVLKDSEFYLLKAEAGPDGDAEIMRKQFRATLESFRNMTSADARIANGQTITVLVAEPGMTYRELAKKSSIKRDGEGILRVINGDHPYGEPTAGD
jgi:predicted Zn-dependent protease